MLAYLVADTRLLQEILFHVSPLDHPLLVEEDLHILPKAAGVIIPDSSGISKRYKTDQ